jgi:hypothetical protein
MMGSGVDEMLDPAAILVYAPDRESVYERLNRTMDE